MKSIYKIFLLALGVYTSAFSQITEITRLPAQDISQSIKESAPVWLSENEIIIFYLNGTKDTIFSTKSNDRGKSWDAPQLVQVIDLVYNQETIYLTALLVSSQRILIAWSIQDDAMKLIYSDDKGVNWTEPTSILGGGSTPASQMNSAFLNLTQWNENTICLGFCSSDYNGYYKLSLDDGITWSTDAIDFPYTSPYQTAELSIISINQNMLLGIYGKKAFNVYDIYSRLSTDFGLNWSDPIKIADEIYHEVKPKVSKLKDESIVVAYQRDNVTIGYIYGDNDIYYKISQNNGATWSTEHELTRYIGNDITLNLSSWQNKTFITFSSERFSVNDIGTSNYQIAFGVLQESIDKFTPPKVYEASVPAELINYDDKEFVYRVKVNDDEQVKSVIASIEDSAFIGRMFDDGMHYDGEANDGILGNIFPLVTTQNPNKYSFNVNKIDLPLNNSGVLADVYFAYNQISYVITADYNNNKSLFRGNINMGYVESGGKYDEGSFLYSAGFFISGYANGNLFANGIATSSLWKDYQPGKVNSSPGDPLNVLYVVNKNDPPFGNSWKKWEGAVSLGADFYDGDKDDMYNPVDKNWNGTWDSYEDMPPIIGDEIAWCVYNDGTWTIHNDHRQIGIEVQQTLFATSYPDLEDIIFIKYKLYNTGLVNDILDSVYFGIWEDADIGDALDDVVGCDTLLQSGFYYSDIQDEVYGENPPSFFTSFLQGPIITTNNVIDTAFNYKGELLGIEEIIGAKNSGLSSHILTIGADPNLNDPWNVIEVRNYNEGKTTQGIYPDPCSFGYFEVRGGVDCSEINPRFWVSGDPVTDVGWINIQHRDSRNLLTTGPFQLEKGKPQEIIIAYAIGRGNDPLNSVTVGRVSVQRAIEEYKSNFASMTYVPPPAIPITNYELFQNYPNPFNPTTTVRYGIPEDGNVTIEIFDILGQRVKTVVSEFQRTGRYEVRLNSTGLASGVYIYQLRVNEFITSKKMVLLK